MLKNHAWIMLFMMSFCVFVLSGCGGGSLDGEISSETQNNQTIPNDYPDTYDTESLLEGSWRAADSSYEFSTERFTFRLNSAYLTFNSTDIKGTIAQSTVSSRQEWQASYDDEDNDYIIDLGIRSLDIDFDNETATMIHQGKDNWRCNIDGNNKILMNITVSGDTLIRVNYQGTARNLYNNIGAEYNFTLTFRKEQYIQ